MQPPRILPALALLLLAACGGAPARQAAPTEDPAVAECRAEASRSDTVREAWRAANLSSSGEQERTRARVADAEARALNDCLRRRGVIRGGGVERVRPPSFF
ncbi:phosphoribosylamine--glycine ligase [Falsiroseomonas oryziterrae]|uniref:phosphoribosylamine--glycine ligase n=1 Tax=Falsiroseomonas oryziterrae TaxID=2911368 RepID=UPI001F2CFCC0|nr:phosphoribosylamine--glycine ligase [Roseomonas sp. NPKOSM-4]